MERVAALTNAHPYIRLFRGKTFVIKASGKVLSDPATLQVFAQDVAILADVGIRCVLVHGGGPQLDQLCAQMGVPQQIVGGRRVTDADTHRLARMLFRGQLNSELVSALTAAGVRAVGLSGGDGTTIQGQRRPPRLVRDGAEERMVDFGFVGNVDRVDRSLPELLLDRGLVPVFCSLIGAADGALLNVNADTVAAALAVALKAEKLILCTTVPGLLEDASDSRRLVSYGDLDTVGELIARGAVTGGMLPKLSAVTDALRGGVPRVHLIDGMRRHALLLEIFTNEGCGTMLVPRREDG